jgi:Carboxypeptidase regulatory-like domain
VRRLGIPGDRNSSPSDGVTRGGENMMRKGVAAVVFVLAAGALLAGAQRGGASAPPVPRDLGGALQPQPGSGVQMSGRVLAGDTNRGLRRATVLLSAGNMQTDRWTSTDADGNWTFADASPGVYTIKAVRDGYVAMSYGQKGPYGAPSTVTVAAGRPLVHLDVTLPRGGVATGRVTDEFGDPVGGALVQAMRVTVVDGFRQLVPVAAGLGALSFGGMTDDRGEYRIYGLPVGTYYLAAAYGRYVTGQSDDRLDYPVTYYPGTPSVAAATPVTVTLGASAAASFAMSPTPLVEVSGRVVNSRGEPASANLNLVPVAPGHAIQAGSRLSRMAARDGQFVFKGVPAGQYFLQAGAGAGAGSLEGGLLQLTVSGEDVSNLLVTMGPAGSVDGHLTLDEEAENVSPNAFFVTAVAAGPGATSVSSRGGRAAIRPNTAGTFVIAGLLGRHLIRLLNAPAGWWLKSVTVDGVDITDTGLDSSGDTHVEVVVSRRMATVSGTVRDREGRPVSDASVVVLATDEAKWTPGTRCIATTKPGTDGGFTLAGLPAGQYAIVAVAPLEAGDETDPERLAQWKTTGQQVSLTEGDTATVTLTAAR